MICKVSLHFCFVDKDGDPARTAALLSGLAYQGVPGPFRQFSPVLCICCSRYQKVIRLKPVVEAQFVAAKMNDIERTGYNYAAGFSKD